jgi:hypothetical protein
MHAVRSLNGDITVSQSWLRPLVIPARVVFAHFGTCGMQSQLDDYLIQIGCVCPCCMRKIIEKVNSLRSSYPQWARESHSLEQIELF